GADVVGQVGGGAGGGGPVDRGRLGAGGRQGDGEDRAGRAALALDDGDVVDRELRQELVVADGEDALAVGDRGEAGAGQIDQDRLVALDQAVAVDGNEDVL